MAIALFTLGCGGEKAAGGSGTSSSASEVHSAAPATTATASAARATPLTELELPAGVVAAFALDHPVALLDKLTTVVAAVEPGSRPLTPPMLQLL